MKKPNLAKAARVLVTSLCMAPLVAVAGAQPEIETHVLKVFLADFEDVPHPARYSRAYFEELLFGLDGPRETPEGRAMSGSVREYFLNLSEGRLDIEGEVKDWVRIPRSITRIPHWKRGMKPFGESWPVIVAETLRGHGIVGEDAREKARLRDGRMPDMLVFMNTDWGTGGVNRGWGRLKEVLGKMKLADLWDDGWSKLPSPYSSYTATRWRRASRSAADGTIDKIPPESELELSPLSIMMHEMGHQLAGWPDLYGPAYEPWGVLDLMGGPAASTHFPMSVSAYLRVRSGWMQYTDMPRRTSPGLELWPLDTHKQALRFPQGPGQECIVAENRWCLRYPHDYGQPPTNDGSRLLLYRLDPEGRRRMMYSGRARGKVTTLIRRRGAHGALWGEGAFTEVTADTVPSSRNSLGELWWEFRDIRPGLDGRVRFDARCAATNLVEEYCLAEWVDQDGASVATGRFSRAGGHVCIRSRAAEDGTHGRSLHIRTSPGGAIRGRYDLPEGRPQRVYATVSLAGDADRPASLSIAPAKGESTAVQLPVGRAEQQHTVVADLPSGTGQVDLVVEARGNGAPASVSVHEAWVVRMPEVTSDLVRATATCSPARAGSAATPRIGPPAMLHDRCTYGPAVLTFPVGGQAGDGWRAEWSVRLPETATVLRAVIGLGADAPVGSRAEVSLKLVGPQREWALMAGLDVEAYSHDTPSSGNRRSNLLPLAAVTLPAEARGQDCKLVLEVAADADEAFSIAVPWLCVCAG